MSGHGPVETAEVLVTVKAAPSLSTKYRETVCVAGVRTAVMAPPEWVRLYPVPYRYLQQKAQFKKYDEIRLDMRSAADPRPESYSPVDPNQIETIGHLDPWADRAKIMDTVPVDRMCDLQADTADGSRDVRSLGWVEPRGEVTLEIEKRSSADLEKSRKEFEQLDLFGVGEKDLTLPEHHFRYHFYCWHPDCNSHHLSIIDWEIAEAWRNWLPIYGPEVVLDKIRETWIDKLCAPDRQTRFFVGNTRGMPMVWMVLGVWWPPKPT